MEMCQNIIISPFFLCAVILNMWLVRARTSCSTASRRFQDVGSKAVLADLVLDGKVTKTLNPKENGRYNATFSIKKIIKGNLPRESDNKNPKITIGEFGPSDPKQCLGPVSPQRYHVFLKQTLPGNIEKFYHISALPNIYFKRDRSIIKKTICSEGCGKCF